MVGDDLADNQASEAFAQSQKKDALKAKLAHLEELASKVKAEFGTIEAKNAATQKLNATLSAVVVQEKEKIRKLLGDDMPQKVPAEIKAGNKATAQPAAAKVSTPNAIKAAPVAQKPQPIAKPAAAPKAEPTAQKSMQPAVEE